eukprot:CAMPEP_0180516966 /NCGR_PEP_ID=MMETSP1036_2-20121128/54241_1 /TAXON_ID=632150 /ORGANISM="Azadinium spinosum, Strain 3D9" /LENGTH=45 /DNA_ID= /DNA_START= /DNA_END= /DNA_ORIENTATION=
MAAPSLGRDVQMCKSGALVTWLWSLATMAGSPPACSSAIMAGPWL